MKKKSKFNKRFASMIDWCGGYAKFCAMAMIVGVCAMFLLLSIYNADPIAIVACLVLIPVSAIFAGKLVS
ncbi:TPA: hypothetical protein ACSTJY_004993 [Serratia fonticola]